MRKIAVVTGTRAEYGLLYWIMKGIQDSSELELELIITGMHLAPEFGLTIREIERDGFPTSEKVEILLSSDTEASTSISMGLGMIGFAKAYERLKPDILLVLGDRFETFAAVAAAVPFRIPVAHIHGGETTEGAIDEQFRHAITKMSWLHFPATEAYARRILQMGEDPKNVFCVGAPGLENIHRLNLLSKNELYDDLEIPRMKKMGLVTYHPVTLAGDSANTDIAELLNALELFQDIYWVITLPNADPGGRTIMERINGFISTYPERGKVFHSLGQMRYLSLLKYAEIMVGNSSSGIIEAPSFRLPVVNIGDRQKGRIKARNIIDVPLCIKTDIVKAIKYAVSKEFKSSLGDIKNPYGEGLVSQKIVEKLEILPAVVRKRFLDQ